MTWNGSPLWTSGPSRVQRRARCDGRGAALVLRVRGYRLPRARDASVRGARGGAASPAGDNSFVVWKRLPREIYVEEEGDPGVLAYEERRHKLTRPETKCLAELLEKARFWERATTSVFDTGEEDGAIWMLEGCTRGEHHVVHWSTHGVYPSLVLLGEEMLRLGGLPE